MSDIYYIESNGKTYRVGEDVKSIMTRDGVVHNFPSGGGNLQSKSAVPSTAQQTIRPDSGYSGLSQVTISAIPANYKDVSGVTATAPDVLTGKDIVTSSGSVQGSMPNVGSVHVTINVGERYSIPRGYHDGTGYVDSGESSRIYLFESGYGFHTENATIVDPTTYTNASTYSRRIYTVAADNEYIDLYPNRSGNNYAFAPIGFDIPRGNYSKIFLELAAFQIGSSTLDEQFWTWISNDSFKSMSSSTTTGYIAKTQYYRLTMNNEYVVHSYSFDSANLDIVRFSMESVNGREIKIKNIWLE